MSAGRTPRASPPRVEPRLTTGGSPPSLCPAGSICSRTGESRGAAPGRPVGDRAAGDRPLRHAGLGPRDADDQGLTEPAPPPDFTANTTVTFAREPWASVTCSGTEKTCSPGVDVRSARRSRGGGAWRGAVRRWSFASGTARLRRPPAADGRTGRRRGRPFAAPGRSSGCDGLRRRQRRCRRWRRERVCDRRCSQAAIASPPAGRRWIQSVWNHSGCCAA